MSRKALTALNDLFHSKGNPIKSMQYILKNADELNNISGNSKAYLQEAIKDFINKNFDMKLKVCTFLASVYAEFFYEEEIENIFLNIFNKLPNINLKNEFLWNLVSLGFRKNRNLDKVISSMVVSLTKELITHIENQEIKLDYKGKDKNVIISTSQFLGVKHSPTRLVLDEYKALLGLGFNPIILLLQVMPQTNDNCFIKPFVANSIKDAEGMNYLKMDEELIPVYIFNGNVYNHQSVLNLLKFISEFCPSLMLAVGGYNVYQEYLAQNIPTVLITTSAMLTPSPNSTLVSLSAELSPLQAEALESEGISSEKYKKIVDLGTNPEYLYCENLANKSTIGLSEFHIVIGIIGSRLNSEIGLEEVNFIQQLVHLDSRIQLLIVGNCSQELVAQITDACGGRAKFTGAVNDIAPILTSIDFLVNLKRVGGGLTATQALGHGILVYSIRYGDVSQIVPLAYQAEDYSQLLKLIGNNLSHERQKSQQLAHAIFKNLSDFKDNLKKILIEFESVKGNQDSRNNVPQFG